MKTKFLEYSKLLLDDEFTDIVTMKLQEIRLTLPITDEVFDSFQTKLRG